MNGPRPKTGMMTAALIAAAMAPSMLGGSSYPVKRRSQKRKPDANYVSLKSKAREKNRAKGRAARKARKRNK